MKIQAQSICNLFTVFFCFQSLAVPVDSIKEDSVPVLFSALQKEDFDLYSKEMKRLLYGPITQFIETIQFKTKEGDTIFHLMAGVSHHQLFFAREMQNLSFAFTPGKLPGELAVDGLTFIGGVGISIPHLEDIDLGKAIQNMNPSQILLIANRLDESSAIEWFQNLHAKTRNGQSLKNFAFKNLDINHILSSR